MTLKTITISVALLAAGCGSTAQDPTPASDTLAELPDCSSALADPVPDGFNGCLDGDTLNPALVFDCDNGPVISVTVNDVILFARPGGTFTETGVSLGEVCNQ